MLTEDRRPPDLGRDQEKDHGAEGADGCERCAQGVGREGGGGMSERTDAGRTAAYLPGADVDLLAVVLDAIAAVGTDSLTVLRPVRGPDGTVDDFVVVADAGLTAQLAQAPSLGRTLREIMPGPFAERLVRRNRDVLTTGRVLREDFILSADADGGALPTTPDPDDHVAEAAARVGDVLRVPVADHVVVLWRDVTEARSAQRDLLAARERFERILEHASDTLVVTTADRVITYASPSLAAVLNIDPEALIGTRFGNFFSDRQDVTVGAELFERVLAVPTGGTARAEAEVLNGAGETRRVAYVATNWVDDPVVGGVVINALDITEQHEAQRRLRIQALSDSLTGLPNRRWLNRALDRALDRSRRTGAAFALLMLDVDNFKVLNDSLGHSAGDRLLVEMSSRMASVLGASESIARLGGDEFVVLAEGVDGPDGATAVADRIAAAAGTRYDFGSLATHVTVSIGAVTSDGRDIEVAGAPGPVAAPPRGATGIPVTDLEEPPSAEAEALLAHADAALYEAKRRGRNRVEVFDPELRARVLHRVHLESELHRALERDELTAYWQPIVRAEDGRHVAVEALVRWQHPARGLVAAAEFLPVALEVGLVPSVCTRAVDLALAQAARWEGTPGHRRSSSTSRPCSSGAPRSQTSSPNGSRATASPRSASSSRWPRTCSAPTSPASPTSSRACASTASASRWTTSVRATPP